MVSFILGLFFLTLAGEGVLEVEVDRDEISINEQLRLTVTIRGSMSSRGAEIPSFSDFEKLGQNVVRSQSSQIRRREDGRAVRENVVSTVYTLFLRPLRSGNLKIEPIVVEIDGDLLQSPSIEILVSEEEGSLMEELLDRLGDRKDLSEEGIKTYPTSLNEIFFIQVGVDKQEVYWGEQVTARWSLLTRGSVRELDTLRYPELQGFWKEDIDIATRLNYREQRIGGVSYRKAPLATVALFPIRDGILEVDSYQIRATVVVPSHGFGSFHFGQPHQFTKISEPIEIRVKPLPEDRPENFIGAVGQFQVDGKISHHDVFVGEALQYTLKFTGRGNAKLINVEELPLPETFEVLSQRSRSDFFENGTSYREITFMVRAKKEGEMEIPAFEFSAFDPILEDYQTIRTEPQSIRVKRSEVFSGGYEEKKRDDRKKESNSDLRLLKDIPSAPTFQFAIQSDRAVFRALLYFHAAFLLFIPFLTWFFIRRNRLFKVRLRRRLQRLVECEKAGDIQQFSREVVNLMSFVLNRASRSESMGKSFDSLIGALPPTVREKYGTQLQTVCHQAQASAFALGPQGSFNHRKEIESLVMKVLSRTENDFH